MEKTAFGQAKTTRDMRAGNRAAFFLLLKARSARHQRQAHKLAGD